MRLCRFEAATGSGVGIVLGDEIADLRKVAPHLSPNPVDILAAGPAGIEAAGKAANPVVLIPEEGLGVTALESVAIGALHVEGGAATIAAVYEIAKLE